MRKRPIKEGRERKTEEKETIQKRKESKEKKKKKEKGQVHRDKRSAAYLKVETNRRRKAISLMESQIHKSAIQSFSFLCVLRPFRGTFQSGSTRTSGLGRYRTRLWGCKRGGELWKLKLLSVDTLSETVSAYRKKLSLPLRSDEILRGFMWAARRTESSSIVVVTSPMLFLAQNPDIFL